MLAHPLSDSCDWRECGFVSLIYTTSEAKARFSEVLRHVREGRTVIVSDRGKRVAEIRSARPDSERIRDRLDELERRRALIRFGKSWKPSSPLGCAPGALDRFLAERDE